MRAGFPLNFKKVTNGEEERYLVDEYTSYSRVIEEKNKNNNLTATYTYGHELISQNRATSVSFYNRDGLGSTIISTAKMALTVDLSRKLVDLMLDEGVSIDDAQKQYINSIIQMAKSDKDKKEDIEEENISKDGEYDNLREKGEPYPKHKVNNKDRSLPVKDEPNSSTDLLNV